MDEQNRQLRKTILVSYCTGLALVITGLTYITLWFACLVPPLGLVAILYVCAYRIHHWVFAVVLLCALVALIEMYKWKAPLPVKFLIVLAIIAALFFTGRMSGLWGFIYRANWDYLELRTAIVRLISRLFGGRSS